MVYCKVLGCRYPHTHSSIAHKCGVCNRFGHGLLECNDRDAQDTLRAIPEYSHILPTSIQCTIPNCNRKWSHTTEAHHCYTCGGRGLQHTPTCPENVSQINNTTTNIINIQCPHCKTNGNVDLNFELFTGTECTICMNQTRMIVFDTCRHANICKECALRL